MLSLRVRYPRNLCPSPLHTLAHMSIYVYQQPTCAPGSNCLSALLQCLTGAVQCSYLILLLLMLYSVNFSSRNIKYLIAYQSFIPLKSWKFLLLFFSIFFSKKTKAQTETSQRSACKASIRLGSLGIYSNNLYISL